MSTSFWLDRSADIATRHFDIVIIGAGIAGASAAYWLARRDENLKIAVLDKGRIASGASGRNAGFITCGSVEHFNRLVERWGVEKAHQIWSFSETNLQLLKDEIIGDPTGPVATELGFENNGSFSLASTTSELAELQQTAQFMREGGLGVEELDASQVHERTGAVGFSGGIKYLADAAVNPTRLVEKIFSQTSERVVVYPHTDVHRIDSAGTTRQVHSDNGCFHCDLVVYATNGYSARLEPFLPTRSFPHAVRFFSPSRSKKSSRRPATLTLCSTTFASCPAATC